MRGPQRSYADDPGIPAGEYERRAEADLANRVYMERVTAAIQNHAEKHRVPYLWAQTCLANGVSNV